MTTRYRIPASYIRGGTSKGVFFLLQDLPDFARYPGPERDKLLLRLIGSPDPYGKHTDGMGGATSSTSKVVIIAPSTQPGHDVDYWFGQVAIGEPLIDWTGNCGNLSAAVGGFAVSKGLLADQRVPADGTCTVRIWQANIKRTIVAHVPMYQGQVQELGDFELDGVTFPAAEVRLEFHEPSDASELLFPTGLITEPLDVPGIGSLQVTLINAGIPVIFLNAVDVGLTGTELQPAVNNDPDMLARFERIRAAGAVRMGLIDDVADAARRQHTPKVAFVAPPADFVTSSGRHVSAAEIDLQVRALSMGQLHHAMMGTAAVCIGTAAAIPGTLVNLAAGGGQIDTVTFGHPSGTLRVGADVRVEDGNWMVRQVTMSRSARTLMEGWVYVPLQT